MSHSAFLWTANILVWIGVFGYLLFLGREKRRLWQRLKQLESDYDEQPGGGA